MHFETIGEYESLTHQYKVQAERLVRALRERGPSEMICGPITTGGAGSETLNRDIFKATIRGLQYSGVSIFDQMTYETKHAELARAWRAIGNTCYCAPIITIIYRRVFESGYITQTRFLPRWESSCGSRMERTMLKELGIPILDISLIETAQYVLEYHPFAHAEHIVRRLKFPADTT